MIRRERRNNDSYKVSNTATQKFIKGRRESLPDDDYDDGNEYAAFERKTNISSPYFTRGKT